jgi:hypothetical protein
MLEFSGAGLAAIREAMAAKEKQMAALGARLLEPGEIAQETATAVRIRHGGDAAALDTITAAVQQATTRMLRWHGWWTGAKGTPIPETVRVTLPSDFFSARLTPQDVQQALAMLLAEKISYKTFYSILSSGQWAREGVTVEQEQRDIIAEGGTMADDDSDTDSNTDTNDDDDVAGGGGRVSKRQVEVTTETVLNGAQVTAATEIVRAVAQQQIPRDAGIAQLEILFNLTRDQATRMMGSAGAGFVSAANTSTQGAP